MSLRCKPGDLAILTLSGNDVNTGKIVHVDSYCGIKNYVRFGPLETWWVKTSSDFHDFASMKPGKAGALAIAPDRYLRPLPGNVEPRPIEETRELELTR